MKMVVRVFVFCLFGMLAIVSSYGQEPVSRVDTTRQSQEEIQEMYIRYASLVMSKHAKERKEYTAKAVIMPVFGFGASQLSGGIMVGYMARIGGYVKLKSGLTCSLSTGDLECDKEGYVEGGDQSLWFTGNKHKSRFAATAGVTYAITKPVFAYVGGNFGKIVCGQHLQIRAAVGILYLHARAVGGECYLYVLELLYKVCKISAGHAGLALFVYLRLHLFALDCSNRHHQRLPPAVYKLRNRRCHAKYFFLFR